MRREEKKDKTKKKQLISEMFWFRLGGLNIQS